jgi:ABC-2 type transport system ATP-binding protein
MENSEITIRVQGLVKKFGDFTAVSGVSFEVRQGEIFGFLGPNGSGKTTTIRMMLGLLKPTAGEAEVLGISVNETPELIRPRVGYMSQRFSLYNDLTVLQNLRFYGRAYGIENSDLQIRIKEALQMAGLEGKENAHTKDLSGGWRQRLALSVAFLHNPEAIFLDEPTAGVDPVSRRAFWDLLYELVTEGVTIFVTTHYMDEAEHCHRLAFIQGGQIIAYGSPGDIKKDTMQGQVLELNPSDPTKAIKILREAKEKGKLDLKDVELFGSLVHVVAPDIHKQKKGVLAELRDAQIKPGKTALIEPSLEDVFITSMRDGLDPKEN